MAMTAYTYNRGRAGNKTPIGVWRAGLPGNITYAPGQSLQPFKVIGVYRVAVVVVSIHISKTDR